MAPPRFWIGVAAAAHVERAVREGFCAFSHGSATAAARPRRGDRFVYYAPREKLGSGPAVQAFTALGTIADNAPVPRDLGAFTAPIRRAEYVSIEPVPVRELLDRLGFVRDKRNWGLAFRRGLFPIPTEDFAVIEAAMTGDRP